MGLGAFTKVVGDAGVTVATQVVAADHHRQQLQRLGRAVGRPRGGRPARPARARRRRHHPRPRHGRRRDRRDRLGLRAAAGPGQRRAVARLARDGQAARPQAGHRARAPPRRGARRRDAGRAPGRHGRHRHRHLGRGQAGARHHGRQARLRHHRRRAARSTCRPRTSPSAPTCSSSSPARSSCPATTCGCSDIGLPAGVAYACLAETVALALEGRYETFTVGRDIEWEKVKEIYQLGLQARHAAGGDLRASTASTPTRTSPGCGSSPWRHGPGRAAEQGPARPRPRSHDDTPRSRCGGVVVGPGTTIGAPPASWPVVPRFVCRWAAQSTSCPGCASAGMVPSRPAWKSSNACDELGAGVHDERAVGRDGLADRPAAEDADVEARAAALLARRRRRRSMTVAGAEARRAGPSRIGRRVGADRALCRRARRPGR